MLDSFSVEHAGKKFGNLDRNCSNENRQIHLIESCDLVDYGIVFFSLCPIDQVFRVDPTDGFVGGNDHHVELIDLEEFGALCFGRARHSR